MKGPTHLLRIYGPPRHPDQTFSDLWSAIDTAREALKARKDGYAEIRERMTSTVVWTSYIAQDGSTVETKLEREPGAD